MVDLPAPATNADQIRRITEAVLSRQEFGEAQPSLFARALRAIGDFIAQFVELVGAGGRASIIGTLVLLAVAAVFVWAVVRFTRSVQTDPARDIAVAGEIGRTAAQWRAEAAVCAGEGRWRDAVRHSYRAVLAELATAGLVDEVAGRTAGEYLAAVEADVPAAAAAFRTVTRRFEAAWYGHAPTTRDDLEAFEAAAATVAEDAGIRRLAGLRS